MSNSDWTEDENARIVADYFEMLEDQRAGRPFVKIERRRELQRHLPNRSLGSIGRKHQNISAILDQLGVLQIDGYSPAKHYQGILADAVLNHLSKNPELLDLAPAVADRTESEVNDFGEIDMLPPPTISNRQPRDVKPFMRVAAKLDIAGRNERNRELGRNGEEAVVAHERRRLRDAGRDDLARCVRWVSRDDGDGAGYDIRSFCLRDGAQRLLEVKTTGGWEWTPFHITRNELEVSRRTGRSGASFDCSIFRGRRRRSGFIRRSIATCR